MMVMMIMLIFPLKWSTVKSGSVHYHIVNVEMREDGMRKERGKRRGTETALEGWRFWVKSNWTEQFAFPMLISLWRFQAYWWWGACLLPEESTLCLALFSINSSMSTSSYSSTRNTNMCPTSLKHVVSFLVHHNDPGCQNAWADLI